VAQVQRHRRAIAAALLGLVALVFAPAEAQYRTDLYDRPVLAIDPGMHTGKLRAQTIDREGRFAVTGGHDRTVRIWSVADGKLLRAIWIPGGPDYVGTIYAVAISPDGSTIAAGGWTERRDGPCPIYLFDRESGNLIRRIGGDLNVTDFLTFSLDGRYLAATIGGPNGLRVFDRDKDWAEAFRDDQYGDSSYGAAFAPSGRLATVADDGLIRLYKYDPNNDNPNFRRVGEPVKPLSGHNPRGAAFSPDGKRLAVGYFDVAAVDIFDGTTLKRAGGQSPTDATVSADGLSWVAWSGDGNTLFGAGGTHDEAARFLLFAWDRGGLEPSAFGFTRILRS
jgi:WD40 repeat protein